MSALPLTPPDPWLACATEIAANPWDLPFALLYRLDEARDVARLVGVHPAEVSDAFAPRAIDLDSSSAWSLSQLLGGAAEVSCLQEPAGQPPWPGGAWQTLVECAVSLPIPRPGSARPYGFLVAGVPGRKPDLEHREFLRLLACQIGLTLTHPRAGARTQQRAEDRLAFARAKALFFANVGHELRTPLTLILGPIEELASGAYGALSQAQLGQTQIVRRSALRLLKRVNDVLDFARIESGRREPHYEPVEIGRVTVEVASVFEAAVERAGLRLRVDRPTPERVALIDLEIWEKILLNLISNAFKQTYAGEIAVKLLPDDAEHVTLEVSDTGVGTPPNELAVLFEPFARSGAETAAGGLGLPMVRELARAHGGTVQVESELGRGSRFRVRVRCGRKGQPAALHAVSRRPLARARAANAFVEDALRALENRPSRSDTPRWAPSSGFEPWSAETAGARVLVADEDADTRGYLARLLGAHFEVEAVRDGELALAAVRRSTPDLVITEAKLPGLDGLALLAELRADPGFCEVPVLILSASADEDERIQGILRGANDYLTKPFSGRELVARASSQIALRRVRKAEARARSELEQARRRAEDASRAKDEFMAMLGHELRNPLAPITTALELMDRDGSTQFARERTILSRQVEHLSGLVDDLLDVSRITRGKLLLRKRPLELSAVIAGAIELASPLLEERRHHLTKRVPSVGLRVMGDELRLVQVVSNLLTNAAKYTPPGGEIEVHAYAEGERAVVSVRDNGVGISAELSPRIFELFVQGARPQAGVGGLGLGLSLVRSLTELHEGSVRVYSAGTGQGSDFEVSLPLLRAHAQALPAPAPPAAPDALRADVKPRVLIVDDNEDAAELLAEGLRRCGHDVRVAFEALRGIDLARSFRPGVALLDLGLPVMDGYELARRLHALPGVDHIHLIAVTGYGQDDDRKRSRQAGFARHLVKPVELGSVDRTIRQLVFEDGAG